MDGLLLTGAPGVQVGQYVFAVIDPPYSRRIYYALEFGDLKVFTSGKLRGGFFPIQFSGKGKGAGLVRFTIPFGLIINSNFFMESKIGITETFCQFQVRESKASKLPSE